MGVKTKIIGLKFGKLTIVDELEPQYTKSGFKKRMVLCRCDCGNEVQLNYYDISKKTHNTKSCGCLSVENSRTNITNYNKSDIRKQRDKERQKDKRKRRKEKKYLYYYTKISDIKDVDKRYIKASNDRKRLCNIRIHMIRRCYNPNDDSFVYYGKKGVTVCDEWLKDKELFINWAVDNGYKDGLSLDRIDTNKGYCPSNCRWVSIEAQMNNTSRNIVLSDKNNKILTLAQWAREYNINYGTLNNRYRNLKKKIGTVLFIEDLI